MLRAALVWMLLTSASDSLPFIHSDIVHSTPYTLKEHECLAKHVKQDPVKVRALAAETSLWEVSTGLLIKVDLSSSVCAFLEPRRTEVWACESHP